MLVLFDIILLTLVLTMELILVLTLGLHFFIFLVYCNHLFNLNALTLLLVRNKPGVSSCYLVELELMLKVNIWLHIVVLSGML